MIIDTATMNLLAWLRSLCGKRVEPPPRSRSNQLAYIDRFLRMDSAPLLLSVKLFPRHALLKEITESVAMLDTLLRHFGSILRDRSVSPENTLCVVIGDGVTPRTGALLACLLPSCEVVSLDPMMREEWQRQTTFRRLTVLRTTIEGWLSSSAAFPSRKHVFLLGVHSHAKPRAFIERSLEAWPGANIYFVTIPCCVDHDLGPEHRLIESSTNLDILSPMRQVLVYQLTRL